MQIPNHIKDFLFKHKFKLETHSPNDWYRNESLTAVVVKFLDSSTALKIYVTKNPEIFICISMNSIIETEILSVMIRKLFIQI